LNKTTYSSVMLNNFNIILYVLMLSTIS
jgi:hypothetical protein